MKIEWSSNFAYAIGLLASDGNLSKDGRHINITSKDEEMITTFKKCLEINNKIGRTARGYSKEKKYFRVQFGDKNFYEFLLTIGITPAKSKTLGELKIKKSYFKDFLRGLFDGDGNIHMFWHPESKNPQVRFRIFSASKKFLNWLQQSVNSQLGTRGFQMKLQGALELAYGTHDSIKILNFIYYKNFESCLLRKYDKTKRIFLLCGAEVAEQVDATALGAVESNLVGVRISPSALGEVN